MAKKDDKTKKRRAIDWQRIEIDYRSGLRTNVEIAAEHSISETAIRNRAKSRAWARDLSKQVRNKVRFDLLKVSRDGPAISDEQIIEEASHQIRTVVEGHLTKTRRVQEIAMLLLEKMMDNEKLSERESSQVLRDCAIVLERGINMERIALSIDDAARTSDVELIILD